MNSILMVVFHYPPLQGSSGIHRALNFSRYLSLHGWRPIILTVTPTAYPEVDPNGEARIPHGIIVERAGALDSARRLSFRGAYPKLFALPDRWISWWPGGVLQGLRLIRRHRPSLVWSTFPIATAHLIGLTLHRLSGLPWVADFRDPMVEKDPETGEDYPFDPAIRTVYGWIESATVKHCSKAIFTTPGAASMYAKRYVKVPESRWAVIPNGFDEESFESARGSLVGMRPTQGPVVLVHSGVLYPGHRDPGPFFDAVAQLRHAGTVSPATLRVVLRASGSETQYKSHIDRNGIADIVSLEPSLPYEAALAEMLSADGLLLFQGSNCNWQIPAKAYEYLRARRPILALTDVAGDTAELLLSEGVDTIAPIDSSDRIAEALREFLERVRSGSAPVPASDRVELHSRKHRTKELAAVLDAVLSNSKLVRP